MRSAQTSMGSPMETHTVGVEDIGTLGSLGGVLLKGQGGTGLGGNGLTLCDQGGIRLILFGGAGGEVQAHLGTANHQAVAHVVAGIAEVDEMDALQAAEVFPDGQEVGKDLGGVELVGQAVPDRNTGVMGQVFHDLLPIARYSMPSNIRPSTRAVSAMDSFLPIWLPDGSR